MMRAILSHFAVSEEAYSHQSGAALRALATVELLGVLDVDCYLTTLYGTYPVVLVRVRSLNC